MSWKVVLKAEGRNPGSIEEQTPPPKPEKPEEPAKPKSKARKAVKEQYKLDLETYDRKLAAYEDELRAWEAREKQVAENTGGMIVLIQNDNGSPQEVSRVSFIRREGICKNPDVSFVDQLTREVAKAEKAVDLANGLFEGAGVNQ